MTDNIIISSSIKITYMCDSRCLSLSLSFIHDISCDHKFYLNMEYKMKNNYIYFQISA